MQKHRSISDGCILQCGELAVADAALLLRVMLVEDVPVGLVVVGVREAQAALLRDAGCLAEGHHVRMPPGGGPVGAAAVDDPLVVHCYVPCMQAAVLCEAPCASRILSCVRVLCTGAEAHIQYQHCTVGGSELIMSGSVNRGNCSNQVEIPAGQLRMI